MIDRREMGECSQHNCFLFVACSLYQRRKDEHLLCVVLAVLSPTRGKTSTCWFSYYRRVVAWGRCVGAVRILVSLGVVSVSTSSE